MSKLLSFDKLQKHLLSKNEIFDNIIKKGFLIHNYQNGNIIMNGGIMSNPLLYQQIYLKNINPEIILENKNLFIDKIKKEYIKNNGEYKSGVVSKQRAYITGIMSKEKALILTYAITAHTDKFINVSNILKINYDELSEKEKKKNFNMNFNKLITVKLNSEELCYKDFFTDEDIPEDSSLYLNNINLTKLNNIINNMYKPNEYDSELILENYQDYVYITLVDLLYGRQFYEPNGLFKELTDNFNKYL
jgi:hypothetical protein